MNATWTWLLACSGPGAMAAIERAELIGWGLLAATAVLLGAAVLGTRRLGWSARKWAWLLVPVAVHPGLWMSARSGDCGTTRVVAAGAMTILAVLVAAIAVWRAKRAAGAGRG